MSVKVIEKDLGWNNIKKNIESLKNIIIKTGLWGEGDPSVNVAYRGAVHQYGLPEKNIPRRPFMSDAFDDGLRNLIYLTVNEYRKVLDNKQSYKMMVDRVGVFHEGQIKNKIVQGSFIPLKPATIAAKGSAKPLIDKAIMKNSVQFKIEKGVI